MSNPFSGIDVDKMDYIARDSKALGVDVTFDFRRYLEIARILKMDDEFWNVGVGKDRKRVQKMVIGVRDKEAMNMVSMFRTRQVGWMWMSARTLCAHVSCVPMLACACASVGLSLVRCICARLVQSNND